MTDKSLIQKFLARLLLTKSYSEEEIDIKLRSAFPNSAYFDQNEDFISQLTQNITDFCNRNSMHMKIDSYKNCLNLKTYYGFNLIEKEDEIAKKSFYNFEQMIVEYASNYQKNIAIKNKNNKALKFVYLLIKFALENNGLFSLQSLKNVI